MASRERVAHTGTRALSACPRPGGAVVARGPSVTATATPNAAAATVPVAPASERGRKRTPEMKTVTAPATTQRVRMASARSGAAVNRAAPRIVHRTANAIENTTRWTSTLLSSSTPAIRVPKDSTTGSAAAACIPVTTRAASAHAAKSPATSASAWRGKGDGENGGTPAGFISEIQTGGASAIRARPKATHEGSS